MKGFDSGNDQLRSTIMTSNRPLEDWGRLIGDVPLATAILDRFLHNAEVIAIAGKRYRISSRSGKPAGSAEEKSETPCQKDEKR